MAFVADYFVASALAQAYAAWENICIENGQKEVIWMYKYKYKYKYGVNEQERFASQNGITQIEPIVKIVRVANCAGMEINFSVEHSTGEIRGTDTFLYLDNKTLDFTDISSGHISAVIINVNRLTWWGLEWQICRVFTEFPYAATVCYKVTGPAYDPYCSEVKCNEIGCF
jgi:hypothetical protein